LDNIGFSWNLDMLLGEQFDKVDVLSIADVYIRDGKSRDFSRLVNILFFFEIDVVHGGGALCNDERVEQGSDGCAYSRTVGHNFSVADRIADVLLIDLI
jgi:hypothetical protein